MSSVPPGAAADQPAGEHQPAGAHQTAGEPLDAPVRVAVAVVAVTLLGPLAFAVAISVVAYVVLAGFVLAARRVLTGQRSDDPSVRLPDDYPEAPRIAPDDPRDPAFTSYYLDQVFVDIGQVVDACRNELAEAAEGTAVAGVTWWLRSGEPATPKFPALAGPVSHAGWALSWAWEGGALIGQAVALLIGVAVQAVHAAVVGVVALGVLVIDEIAAAAGRTALALGRAPATCPYPTCEAVRVVPAYECPGGERHYDLRPGRLGVWWRVCGCDRRLPTTRLGGRNRLAAVCPWCGNPLPAGLGHAPVRHVQMVGSAGAGKTALLTAILGVVKDQRLGDAVHTPGGENVFFEQNLLGIREGKTPQRTRSMRPLLLKLDPGPLRRKQFVYFFDPRGEIYNPHHSDGIIFAVDLLPSLTLTPDEQAVADSGKPADEAPIDVYNEICEYLGDTLASDGRRFPLPLAVVVTKFDVLARLRAGEGLTAGTAKAQDASIRSWLAQVGQEPLVARIRLDFPANRFWAFSARDAVGSRHDRSNPTDSQVVLEPLEWLLRNQRHHPLRIQLQGIQLQRIQLQRIQLQRIRRWFRPVSGTPPETGGSS